MNSFIIPTVLWGYILSVVFAPHFWGVVFDWFSVRFDLSPAQGWILPGVFNILFACIGIPQIAAFITSIRRRNPISVSRQIASSLSLAGVVLSLVVSILGAVQARHHLARAASELFSSETDVMAAGQITNGLYFNKAVGVVMELPKDWHAMTPNTIRRTKESGTDAIAGGNARKAEEMSAKRTGVYTLFAVRRYVDAHPNYNPSLVLSAYDKQAVATTGIRTLEEYAQNFTKLGAPYQIRNGPSMEHIGTGTGYHIHLEGRLPGATIQQHVYAMQTASFYVVAIASFMEESDFESMQKAITTLQLRKMD